MDRLLLVLEYRRSYDSEFSAPLVLYHVWPALMEGEMTLVKGEAVTAEVLCGPEAAAGAGVPARCAPDLSVHLAALPIRPDGASLLNASEPVTCDPRPLPVCCEEPKHNMIKDYCEHNKVLQHKGSIQSQQ
ncbi:hypothetical protein WMY93_010583 [Mugilogobius chulae]|uniref:Mitochondria-eating protein n=1 Tax=Mugilogobius chulae TaxID=88201 RepID=A0AAW0PI65_9GOBI